ncbi:TetR/AcrR family transcriptional regulator [Roseovarius confluentis]|uniref:TetR/AcrR family transcriptional regulator n=1 Tax=Roseovarius confluentis TaxID=1852027 RepID=UPI000CDDBE64|nr:TetR/AcrR family transcriptional regulator [Roseovarius confluentis]
MARTQGSHSKTTGPRVREAAMRLFARHGFAAVSMRQIANEVGVQAGALYNYTPDKQSLLFDLMREHMDALLAAWQAEDPGGDDPRARLEAFTRFHIRFNTRRADAVFVSYMELRNLTAENFEAVTEMRRVYETRLEEILCAGKDAGVFTLAEPRITAMAVIALLTGVNTWYREAGRLNLDEVETLYWDMVRRLVEG